MTGYDTKGKFWSGNDIRETFLRFFESKGHRRVRSSSLVPHGDATLLFTNAGMNQFKDVFLGLEKRDYTRATTAQKCVRAGGKHNDLENVGFTKRHHTFFEMLGNFSFGPVGVVGDQFPYFKREAIAYAWELLTSPEWFAIPKERLYVTVFKVPNPPDINFSWAVPDDEDSKKYWLDQGVPSARIGELGFRDNFWQMGDTGPCGPCSEIHYDMGPAASDEGHADCKFPCDCGRYVEIWNLVFMQYNREPGGLSTLPKQSVDTGAGLERLAATMLNLKDPTKNSNYETDLFLPLMERAAELCDVDSNKEEKLEEGRGGAASLRVIADHYRAATFLLAEDVKPSNEGRGYVLRKILRRALSHGNYLNPARLPQLHLMGAAVREVMGGAYPELLAAAQKTSVELINEEDRFLRITGKGLRKLDEILVRSIDAKAREELAARGAVRYTARLSGRDAFFLYDTLGLPRDLIEDETRDRNVAVDWQEFDEAMAEQRKQARASWKGGAKEAANPAYAKLAERFKTEPDFYFGTTAKDSRIEAIVTKNGLVKELKSGEEGEVVLDRTAIYAESGGQAPDNGQFYDNSGSLLVAMVVDAYYPVAGLIAHRIIPRETLHVGDHISVLANEDRRARIIRNHTGTHLVHAALRNILGTHVKQSGSLNAPERLRFDFSHFAHVDAEELRDIEQQVNDEIRLNTEIETNVTSLEEALASGALAFFGDKYPEHNVRVVTIPDPRAARGFYSKELCGGTHVQRVGDIGVFKIVSEESVAAGVRRIEAVTGIGALEHFQKQADILRQLASQLNVGEDGILAQVEKLSQTAKQLEKELEAQKREGALSQIDELAGRVQIVKGIKVIAAEVQNVDREGLRQLVDSLRKKLGSGVVALGMPENGKVALIAGVTKDLTAKVHAGKLIQALAKQLGGSGGGRPDLAEAGAKDTAGLKSALLSIPSLLEALL